MQRAKPSFGGRRAANAAWGLSLIVSWTAWWCGAEASLASEKGRPSRLAVIQPAPDFTLTTHADRTLRLSDLKGQVLVVSFIFTTCNGTCPATTHRLAQVQQALKDRGVGTDGGVRFLSVTLDPARDTPAVLRRYMQLYDIDDAGWIFLTGAPDQVRRVWEDWGMWARPADNAQLDHPSRVYLVDRRGRVREIYNLGFIKTPWVLEDIELLLKDG
jgi:protein SCO1/2